MSELPLVPVDQEIHGAGNAIARAAADEDALTWADLPIDQRTKEMYVREYAAAVAWCDVMGYVSAPMSARALSRYLEHLVDNGYAIATATRVRAAVSVAHEMMYSVARSRGLEVPPNPARDMLVRATLTRLKKAKLAANEPIEEPKVEIRYEDLVAMVESEPRTLTGQRNRAIMAVAWFGLLRRAEVVSTTMRGLRYRRGRAPGFEVSLLKSKANKSGKPEVVALSERADLPVCPVRELQAWLEESKISSGPVFRRVYPSKAGGRVGAKALSATVVMDVVKAAGDRVGVATPDELGAHSLRSGAGTEMSAENVSTDRVLSKGRWASLEAARKYLRKGDALSNDPMRTILRDRE